ncbi:MAG: hypothetical protein ACE5OS_11300 [Anaerolineae bacterium]
MNHSEKNPAQQWEQALIDDYYNYRWQQLLEPLCDRMQRWKAGELTYADMDQILNEVHQQVCEIRSLITQRRDRLVMLIQWLDREWFENWVKSYSPPPDVRLVSPLE